ncbi:MAG: hypothetical protein NC079_00660 [Clostridium sp.]|nr:hypothetical protein [Acetatifactor muris]MCM1527452.1 hypothetical protein [Bacteroides sp.]MCM1562102.1 hypothetical protein [Clostridium sp.]
MFICGSNWIGGELACALTPTDIADIRYVELQEGIYDDLYITTAVDFAYEGFRPEEWDFDTVLWARFENNTNAGNIDWSPETTSHIILKSRTEGNFRWKTLAVKEIHAVEDFVLNYPDYFVASGQPVEYAIVPVLYGSEGPYAATKVTSQFHKMFLIEGNLVWGTEMTDGLCNTTRNIPSSAVTLLNGRYPVWVRNTIANYETGNCSGSFVPLADDAYCEPAYSKKHDYKRVKYQREFMDFLCDGIPKILKLPDGRLWIIQVTDNPADTADRSYNDRQISWSWMEVGDVNSEEDLYYLGLSEITTEWWNK